MNPKPNSFRSSRTFETFRDLWPVVNPTDELVTSRHTVTMGAEIAGLKLEFNSHPFTVSVSDAVRESGLYTLDA